MIRARFVFNSFIPRLLKVEAITLYPFVFFARPYLETDLTTMRHEFQHVRQVREFGFVEFYCSYVWEFLTLLIKHRKWDSAYYLISYEIEARQAEDLRSYPLSIAEERELVDIISRASWKELVT